MINNIYKKLYIAALIIIISIKLLNIYLERHFLSRKMYAIAKKMARKKNKKLMVIGDPCTINYPPSFFNLPPNSGHGDVCVDLYGCEKCDKVDINKDLSRYKTNEYIIFETGTLSYSNNIHKTLKEIKRISNGRFLSSGGTYNFFWKHIVRHFYEKKHDGKLFYMIKPFNFKVDKYYYCYDLVKNKNVKIKF